MGPGKPIMSKRLLVMGWFALLWVLTGCISNTQESMRNSVVELTPTTYVFFTERNGVVPETASQSGPVLEQRAVPTVANYFRAMTPLPLQPSPTPFSTIPPPTPDLARVQIITETIYADSVHPNWVLFKSPNMIVDAANTQVVRQGRQALAITPQEAFSTLYFAVRPETSQSYRRNEVLGVSLWLNSGDEIVALEDLAVTVVGSNAQDYWVAEDDSVMINDYSFFSETRLYYLGLNRSVPPNTWVELTLWLDDLPFDPDYTYVTGIYIKNDATLLRTIYVDDVTLILLNQNAATLIPTPAPEVNVVSLELSPPAPTATQALSATVTATAVSPDATPAAADATSTPTATVTPTPLPLPTATPQSPSTGPLEMDLWVLEGRGKCLAEGQWEQRIFMEGRGGNGVYTYYWDSKIIGGPLVKQGIAHPIAGSGDGFNGVGRIVSGDGQTIERDLFIPGLNC
jgi:hypothetical protein